MNPFRRPEVIGLFILVLVGSAWVLLQQHPTTDPLRSSTIDSENTHECSITRVSSVPDGEYQRFRIEFTLRHTQPSAFVIGPNSVKLFALNGSEFPHFFSPGEFPPDIPPATPASSWAEFWLTSSQAQAPLTLEVAGKRMPVPSPQR